MLALGITEESTSPWQSPPVLVPKPDESVWFCIDFRKLDNISTFDAMPRVDTQLEVIWGAQVLSTID